MLQLQADSAGPPTGSGDATLTFPGRNCWTVPAGTESHASGTCWNSPGRKLVMSALGTTGAGPGPPPSTSPTTVAPAISPASPPARK